MVGSESVGNTTEGIFRPSFRPPAMRLAVGNTPAPASIATSAVPPPQPT
jgi:hypothetical protein